MHCIMGARLPKLTEQITVRVPEDLYKALGIIGEIETRKQNEVARFLLERGITAYLADKILILSSPPEYSLLKSQDEIEITVHQQANKK